MNNNESQKLYKKGHKDFTKKIFKNFILTILIIVPLPFLYKYVNVYFSSLYFLISIVGVFYLMKKAKVIIDLY